LAEDALAALSLCLTSVGPVVLVLDNFESLWNAPGIQTEATRVLQTLEQSPNVQLVLTMRGDLPPAHATIQWTKVLPKPLSLSAATELFLAVNPNTQKNEYKDLDELLLYLDGLPLAIRLLAEQKRSSTCKSLLRRWKHEKTSLLQTNSQDPTHLSSLDVSISMSVTSGIMNTTPEAIQLLALICHLPTGVKGGIEQLVEMSLGFSNIDKALAAILSAALAEQYSDIGIRVLSPIRQYILSHFNLPEHHLSALYKYYIHIVHEHAEKKIGDDGFHHAMDVLLPEMGNITYLFMQDLELQEKSRPGLALAALKVSQFQNRTIPSGEILDILLNHWPKYSLNFRYVDILLLRSRIYRRCHQYKQAQEKLKQTQIAFIEIGDQSGAAWCVWLLGDIHSMCHEYSHAREKLEQAWAVFVEIGDQLGAAQCIKSLGDIHSMCNEYDQARKKLEQAQIAFVKIGHQSGVAHCIQSLGNIHYICKEYNQAREKLDQAWSIFVDIGDQSGVAQCMQGLGNVHNKCNEYEQAREKLEQAQIAFVEIGYQLGAAECMQSLGNIHFACKKYGQAIEKLEQAQSVFVEIGNQDGIAQCMQSLDEIHHLCNQQSI
jgi:tetratricopeptide (TPR) repeat protein